MVTAKLIISFEQFLLEVDAAECSAVDKKYTINKKTQR